MPPQTKVALRYALHNYVPVLAEHAPLLVLPLVVLVSVGSTANASFYIAWGATAFTFIVPTAIAQVFLVEGGRDGNSLDDQTKLALGLSVVLMVVASLVAWLGHDLVTVIYGASYERAADILPELVVAAIPWAITSIGLSRARIEHDSRGAFRIAATFACAVLAPALIWTQATGIGGAAHAWVVGNVVAACVAALYLFPQTRKLVRRP
jgi:O-antigen/teichoic acid export membrane protein